MMRDLTLNPAPSVKNGKISKTVEVNRPPLASYEELYKHFHSHPELSFREKETAARIKQELKKLPEYAIHSDIGGHGLAAVFHNGTGTTVLLRADIDGLPVEEKTGLPYASKARMKDSDGEEKPTMHACGHDMHITSLLTAAELMVKAKEEWSGTLILCFQPAEEKGGGATAMVEGGLYDKVPIPDIVLGGHVMPHRAGTIGTRRGLMACAADSFHCTLHGRGGHASQPHRTCDPVVMAASIITRLQTIVSREVDSADSAVVTVGAVKAGDAENIIPDRADLKINVRTIDPDTRESLLKSLERIIRAECEASNAPAPPELTSTTSFPFTVNDAQVTEKLESTFSHHFRDGPHSYDSDVPRLAGSEDFGILATAIGKPSCFFTYGGVDSETWDKAEKKKKILENIPVNHSPLFAPVIQPTLRVAVDGYAVGALTWLLKD
ncbi:metal-dependent amidase/aminoacylase/carboxypeptidase [Aulographum hederae CBS 113979]|uniref:Metal-dependent amidase/aminoacylase/carboxypeptidase n=1 Tax=Aulographum hederae CBS 113979 TaxID=1176131 RepID=A0A6G1GJI9_9PEZI|nr:metal-dependent amidase/aminoacylase/carboxypeptidase [Aulographum hederae CBS 113979]